MNVNDIINKELNLKINNSNKIKIVSHEKVNIINKENTNSFYTNEITIPKERLTLLYTDFYENKLSILFQNLIKNTNPATLQFKSEKTYNDITNITTEFDQFNKKIYTIKKNLNFGNKFDEFVKTKESNILGKVTDYILKEDIEYDLEEIFSISNDAVKSFNIDFFKDQETFDNVILKFFNYKTEEEEILINSDRIVGQILSNLSVSSNSFIYPNCFNSKNQLNAQVNINDKYYENKSALPILNLSNFFNDSNIDNIDSVLNKNSFNIDKFSFYNTTSVLSQNNRIRYHYKFNKNLFYQSPSDFSTIEYFRNYYKINERTFPKFFRNASINISNSNYVSNPGVFYMQATNDSDEQNTDYEVYFVENGLHSVTKNRPTLTQNFYKIVERYDAGNTDLYSPTVSFTNIPDINGFLSRNNHPLNSLFENWRENNPGNASYSEIFDQLMGDSPDLTQLPRGFSLEGLNRLIITNSKTSLKYRDTLENVLTGERLSSFTPKDIENTIVFNDEYSNISTLPFFRENTSLFNFDTVNTNFITRSSLSSVEKTNLNSKFHDYYTFEIHRKPPKYFNMKHFEHLNATKINNDLYSLKIILNEVLGYEYELNSEELFENRVITIENLNNKFNLSEENIFTKFNKFTSISEYKHKISKYLCFNKKPLKILSDFSEGIKKTIKNNKFGILYSENDHYSIYSKEKSPFLNKGVMKNNFINIENYNIKSSENFIFNNNDISQIENVENINDVKNIFKNNFKNNFFKNRKTGFKLIIKDNIDIIRRLSYTGNEQEKNKRFVFEKLLTKTLAGHNKSVRKELVKMILYGIFNSEFDTSPFDGDPNIEVLEEYNNVSDIINFNKIHKSLFSPNKIKKLYSYTNFKINKNSKMHTLLRGLINGGNYTVSDVANSALEQKKTNDLRLYNHRGEILNILPDGIIKKVGFGESIRSWFGLEYRNNFDIYFNKENSGIYDVQKINEESFSPYYNMSILYFDPDNTYWGSLNKFFDGSAGYNDLDIRSDNSAYTVEFRKKIKEGVTNSKDFFQSFPYIEKNVMFKNYFFELSKKDNETASSYIKNFVIKILEASDIDYNVIGKDDNKIKSFLQGNEKIINDISNLLEIYCTILDTSFNILTKLSCFDILHNSIERHRISYLFEEDPAIDTIYRKTSVYNNISTNEKEASIADLKKLYNMLEKHVFNYDGLDVESFTPAFSFNPLYLENVIQTRRFFNLQEISRSLIDTDILEAMSLDIYVSYLLNFEKNKNKLAVAKDSLDNVVSYISNTINTGNENLNKEILKNFGNKSYLNYLSRETNNILHYKEIHQTYLNTSRSQPAENLYTDFKFEHRLEEIKNKIETSDISLQEFIDKTGDSLNVDIVRIGIPSEVYNNLTFSSLIKLEIIPFCHALPDFIFRNIVSYYSPMITNIKSYQSNTKNKVGVYIKNSESFIERYKILSIEEAKELLKDNLNNNDKFDYYAQKHCIQSTGELTDNYLDLFLEKIVDDHYTSNNIKNISMLDQKVFDEVLINNIKSSGAKTIDPEVFNFFNNMTNTKFYNIFGKNKSEILNINEMENGYYNGKLMWEVLEKNNISQVFIEELQKDITNIELFKNLKEPKYYDIFSIMISKDRLKPSGDEITISQRLNNDPNAAGTLSNEFVLNEIKNNFTFVLKVEIL